LGKIPGPEKKWKQAGPQAVVQIGYGLKRLKGKLPNGPFYLPAVLAATGAKPVTERAAAIQTVLAFAFRDFCFRIHGSWQMKGRLGRFSKKAPSVFCLFPSKPVLDSHFLKKYLRKEFYFCFQTMSALILFP
jgi:hypothetical protein